MRTLRIPRHSITKNGEARGQGSDLSLTGVVLARQIGTGLGSVDVVADSPSLRTILNSGSSDPAFFQEIGHYYQR